MTEYIQERTIESPGFIIRIHRPVITAEVREKRMNAIYKAAKRLLKDGKKVKV